MAPPDDEFATAIPEADRLDQEQRAVPTAGPDQGWPDHVTPDVDEADQLEQAHEVLEDPDEQYAPNPSGE